MKKTLVILLLDEPTWDLDPLNTYLVVSILSNAAKKYGSAVILTMEKPRSDVFPFLDRVLYLCLGKPQIREFKVKLWQSVWVSLANDARK